MEQCKRGIPENSYDIVQLTVEESIVFVDALNNHEIEVFDLLTKPAFPYFTAILTDSGYTGRVVFAPSYLPKKLVFVDGVRYINTPTIDAYLYRTCTEGTPDAVIVISALKMNKADKNDYLYATTHEVRFTNLNTEFGNNIHEQMNEQNWIVF
jgi:hypothetical protein